MSDRAVLIRDQRRRWAVPGSSHDRLIQRARIVLPVSITALVVMLAIVPLTGGREISFVLDKNKVQVARERMRVTEALYRGQDSKGQAFEMRAGSAVQATSADPIVKLQQLNARIQLTDGPAVIVAPRGRYDMDTQRVAIDGPVTFRSQGGYTLDTHNVVVDLPSRTLASQAPVTGKMPIGTFAGDRMHGDLTTKTIVLQGHARLHITQTGGRATK